MPVTYVNSFRSGVLAAPATTVTVSRDAVERDDLLVAFIVVTDVVAEAATLTSSGWVVGAAVTNGDLRVFRATRYVDDPTTEPTSYTFTYSASRGLLALMLVYRGVLRDKEFDVINWPAGYFAPNGSVGASRQDTTTAILSPVTATHTDRAYARAVTLFVGRSNTTTVVLDDVSPLVPIRAKSSFVARSGPPEAPSYGDRITAVVVDEEFVNLTSPLPVRTVDADASVAWISFVVVLEPISDVPATYDTYKAKIARSLVTPPYDASASTPLGRLLLVIGRLDNDIGGLHGDDFLPNDPASAL